MGRRQIGHPPCQPSSMEVVGGYVKLGRTLMAWPLASSCLDGGAAVAESWQSILMGALPIVGPPRVSVGRADGDGMDRV
ncbi:hypothetical protein ACLOJK_005350, partial [Asimina triloba]